MEEEKNSKLLFNRQQGPKVLEDVQFLEQLVREQKIPLYVTAKRIQETIERFKNYDEHSFKRQFRYICEKKTDFNKRKSK